MAKQDDSRTTTAATDSAADEDRTRPATGVARSPYLDKRLNDLADRCAKSISSMLDEAAHREARSDPKTRFAAR